MSVSVSERIATLEAERVAALNAAAAWRKAETNAYTDSGNAAASAFRFESVAQGIFNDIAYWRRRQQRRRGRDEEAACRLEELEAERVAALRHAAHWREQELMAQTTCTNSAENAFRYEQSAERLLRDIEYWRMNDTPLDRKRRELEEEAARRKKELEEEAAQRRKELEDEAVRKLAQRQRELEEEAAQRKRDLEEEAARMKQELARRKLDIEEEAARLEELEQRLKQQELEHRDRHPKQKKPVPAEEKQKLHALLKEEPCAKEQALKEEQLRKEQLKEEKLRQAQDERKRKREAERQRKALEEQKKLEEAARKAREEEEAFELARIENEKLAQALARKKEEEEARRQAEEEELTRKTALHLEMTRALAFVSSIKCSYCDEIATRECAFCNRLIACDACTEGTFHEKSFLFSTFQQSFTINDQELQRGCGGCCFVAEMMGGRVAPQRVWGFDPIERTHGLALRVEHVTADYFFAFNVDYFPDEMDAKLLRLVDHILQSKPVLDIKKFQKFIYRQIELTLHTCSTTFDIELGLFLELQPARLKPGVKAMYSAESDFLVESFRKAYRLRRDLDEISESLDIGQLKIVDFGILPEPLAVRFRIDNLHRSRYLPRILGRLRQLGYEVPFRFMAKMPFSPTLDRPGMDPFDQEIVDAVSRLPRALAVSLFADIRKRLMQQGELVTTEAMVDIFNAPPRVSFLTDPMSPIEARSRLKNTIAIINVRSRLNSIQRDPHITIVQFMKKSDREHSSIVMLESSIKPKNMAQVDRLIEASQM